MEESGDLDPDSECDLFALHFVYLPILSEQIMEFRNAWNNHGLRTEGNRTPIQLFLANMHLTPPEVSYKRLSIIDIIIIVVIFFLLFLCLTKTFIVAVGGSEWITSLYDLCYV